MEVGRTQADKLLHTALDGLAARQRAISDNVANVDTPGFKASRVEFEGALKQATGASDAPKMAPVKNAVAGPGEESSGPQVVRTSNLTRRSDGNNVDVDEEMVSLAETNVTYNAVAQLVSARLKLIRTAIYEGRR
jgi:flagellar basal-body rod protein FlgB